MSMVDPFQNLLRSLAQGLKTHNQAIVVAPPGTGKTTRIPPYLLEHRGESDGQIIVLEPRRVAARASASFIASQMGEAVGKRIGYELRLERKISKHTRINFQTEGLFLRRLIADPELEGISHLIFDEFHERSLNADLCLALALDIQSAIRPDLRIIIMSATLDVSPVQSLMPDALFVQSEAPHYPVQDCYMGRDQSQPIERQMAQVISRATQTHDGSILAFLPGQSEINRCAQILEDQGLGIDIDVYKLHGQLEGKVQDDAIAPSVKGRRKIVLSTAIAQTSLTIEGVSVVVDSGLSRLARYEPKTGLSRLVTEKSSRATAEQRRGRAGRTGPGTCYHLWDEEQNRALKFHDQPEILNADLSALALILADWGVEDVSSLCWVDRPPEGPLAQARALLRHLGALDLGGRITSMGKAMVQMPLHPRLSHMILKAGEFGQAKGAAYLAALLSDQNNAKAASNIEMRFDQLMQATKGRLKALKSQAAGWARVRHLTPSKEIKLSLGALLSLGYPDRIAKARRDRPGYFTLANGRGAYVESHDELAKHDFVCVFELGGNKETSRIFSGLPMTKDELELLHAAVMEERLHVEVEKQSGQLRSVKQRCLGAVNLSEMPAKLSSDDACAAFLGFLRSNGLSGLPWSPATLNWLQRARFLAVQCGDDSYEKLSEEALCADVENWCAPVLDGVQSLSAVDASALDGAVKSLLTWEEQQRLERAAPSHFTAPTGSRHRIDYGADGGPIVSLRIQECFGLKSHPKLGGQNIPLRLALLSPAQRPIQITTDLPGFWAGSYAQVRAEMRGRYPKHPWPEDPAHAAPTRRAKPRKL